MNRRAKTYAEKRMIMERILAVWTASPAQRLGQLLDNAVGDEVRGDLFLIEDLDLVEAVEAFGKKDL